MIGVKRCTELCQIKVLARLETRDQYHPAHQLHSEPGMLDLGSKLVRLAPNGTNLVISKCIFQYILARQTDRAYLIQLWLNFDIGANRCTGVKMY